MTEVRNSRILRTISLLVTIYLFSLSAKAQYGGGSGESNDPYLIYTVEQLNEIGLREDDWDKHFILMADIDMSKFDGKEDSPEFNIIARDTDYTNWRFQGIPFTGSFDGKGHTISNFNYNSTDTDYIGLFGCVSGENAVIKDLGLIDSNIDAETGDNVGLLVGYLENGTITGCYVEGGSISGEWVVGGLVGWNRDTIANCYSTSNVTGNEDVGGLAGDNHQGIITNCYSAGSVTGNQWIGGLVGGLYHGSITGCYSAGSVSGEGEVGGLVGYNYFGTITNCYATTSVFGNDHVGGLVGTGGGAIASFWDTETSGQLTSTGGKGRTTAEMQMAGTFFGWSGCENEGIWTIDEGKDYPRLWWENKPGEALETQQLSDFLTGTGTKDDPYLIYTVEQINIIGVFPCDWDKHYKLMADIDLGALTGKDFNIIGISYDNAFTGVFDGNGHKISNFSYTSTYANGLGFFGYVADQNARIKDLGLIDPNIDAGIGDYVGSLVGWLRDGTITRCYVEGGVVSGDRNIGGLVGAHGEEKYYPDPGNEPPPFTISNCYSTAIVVGHDRVGGLVGHNNGTITNSYATGPISGNETAGGLVGRGIPDEVISSFWDTETSGQQISDGGIGKTTAEMQTAATFMEPGWGCNQVWTIDEGNDYPRLWWEDKPGHLIEPTQKCPMYATNPSPPDGALHKDTWANLSWKPGDFAVSHEIYFGDNFDDVNEGIGGTFQGHQDKAIFTIGLPGFSYPDGLVPGTTYYWRIDEFDDIHPESPWKGDIWSFRVARQIAYSPSPPDGAIHEDTWVSLSWSPGDYAVTNRVYFGDNFDDVNEGTGGTFRGNRTPTSYVVGLPGFAYPDGLIPGTTYYWRIDEINNKYPESPWKGNVWSFTVMSKISYNPSPPDGAIYEDTWVGLGWSPGDYAVSHDVYFGDNFDDVNEGVESTFQSNQADTFFVVGFEGFSYPDGLAPGTTYYWRVDEVNDTEPNSPWKGDVWSFWIPPETAYFPEPSDGAEQVNPSVKLSWTSGLDAKLHTVYFGDDFDAINNAVGNLPRETTTYEPRPLNLAQTYYWRVDEVNNVNPDSPWKGPVWRFTTADFIIVDDFESYNDLDPTEPESNRIFETWIDGWGDLTNGSIVGYELLWRPGDHVIVHSGAQSMPFSYDNSVGKSEATANVDNLTIGKDWTIGDVEILSLWFRGDSDNAAETMYVALNGSAVVNHDNPNASQINKWTEWRIDLQAFADQGVNLANIDTISIGLGNKKNPVAGGSGRMFFDDIRLYRPAP